MRLALRKQHGAVLLAMLLIVVLGASYFMVSRVDAMRIESKASERAYNAVVLNRAKQALVGYVADVRVRTGHHRWRDALGGVAVGWGVSKFFVTPLNATYIAPVIGPHFIGFRWERSF